MKPSEIHTFNTEQLRANGVSQFAQPAYKTVRNVGDLKQATLWDGTVVERREHIFVNDVYGLVKCAPYELHFIYETPKTIPGWGLYCTCGSIAAVVGMTAYSKLASPTDTGHMLVCVRHTTLKQNEGIGRHADGSTE